MEAEMIQLQNRMGDAPLLRTADCTNSFQERFIQRRLSDVKIRITNFLKKSGNGKHTVTHGTFRKLISPTFYKTESRQAIKLLEAEGFLRDSGVYLYVIGTTTQQTQQPNNPTIHSKNEKMRCLND